MSCGKEKDKNFRLCVCMYISITYFFFSWSHIWRAEILILFLQGAQVSHTQTVQGEGADTRGHDFRARHVLCHVVLSHVSFFSLHPWHAMFLVVPLYVIFVFSLFFLIFLFFFIAACHVCLEVPARVCVVCFCVVMCVVFSSHI